MKKLTTSPRVAAIFWRSWLSLALIVAWTGTGLAQVSFSARPGSDPAVRVEPREPIPAEAEPPPVSIPKETSVFSEWKFFPDGVEKGGGTPPTATPPAPLRLGDVTFNQMAESVNAWKTGAPKANDLSRQFHPDEAASHFIATLPTGAWLIGAIVAFVILVGMALSQYGNDHDERKRQKRRHHHEHRHHHRHRRRTSEEQGDLSGPGSV